MHLKELYNPLERSVLSYGLHFATSCFDTNKTWGKRLVHLQILHAVRISAVPIYVHVELSIL